jgi:hypothetical protein
MTVALGGVCAIGPFILDPLQPGYVYLGPTQPDANSCRCSSVYYSLLSACAYCQNQTYLEWKNYTQNCSTIYLTFFKDALPVVVPHYAYLDVSINNTFDVSAAMTAGGPASSPVPQATSATTAKATATNTSVAGTSKELNVGAIVGGVIGGMVVIVFVVGIIVFMMRRRKQPVTTPSTTTYAQYSSPQMSGVDTNYNSTGPTMTPGRIYDPNDPSTFPSFPNPYDSALPNDASNFPSYPVNYSTYSLVGGQLARTHYTGAPEL